MIKSSMVVDDFNELRAIRRPSKTDAELVVDSNTVLALTVSFKCFEPVAWGNPQVLKSLGSVQSVKFPSSHGMQLSWKTPASCLGGPAVVDVFGGRVCEGLDHDES
jgi:hypothetical protein